MISPDKAITNVRSEFIRPMPQAYFAELAKSLGGWSERVEEPNAIVPALKRAYKTTQDGKAALLEFVTSREINYSRMRH